MREYDGQTAGLIFHVAAADNARDGVQIYWVPEGGTTYGGDAEPPTKWFVNCAAGPGILTEISLTAFANLLRSYIVIDL